MTPKTPLWAWTAGAVDLVHTQQALLDLIRSASRIEVIRDDQRGDR